jgi:hypothetical protein|tara:strand:- start:469 stop:993 length:525 start_codon:yes stop_codon:yes gene_type:complete
MTDAHLISDAQIAEFWPDMATPEGRAEIRRQLDLIMETYADMKAEAEIRLTHAAMDTVFQISIVDHRPQIESGWVKFTGWPPIHLIPRDSAWQPHQPTDTVAEAARLSNSHVAPVVTVAEAARVLLAAHEAMPTEAKLAAVKAHLGRDSKVQPVAVIEAWRAALRSLAEEGGDA